MLIILLITVLATVLLSSVLAYLLSAWFHSEAFVSYGSLYSPLARWLKIPEYQEALEYKADLSYPNFLLSTDPESFLFKLLSCPLCLSAWVSSALTSTAYSGLYMYTGLWVWSVISLPASFATAYVGLFMYLSLVKLLK